MSEAFGALRSLLARPSAPAWRAALRRINGWEDAHERDEVVLPYAREVFVALARGGGFIAGSSAWTSRRHGSGGGVGGGARLNACGPERVA